MKEKFTTAEWEQLRSLPFQVFVLVVMSDKKFDKEEAEQIAVRLAVAAGNDPDPLLRELAADLVGGGPAALEQALQAAMDPAKSHPEEMKRVLRDNLSEDEYQSFMGSLFADAVNIARATGGRGGIFKKKKKQGEIAADELKMLGGIAAFWEVDLPRVAARFGST